MLSLEVRDMIARYLSSEISLEELEDWFIRHLPELAADPHSHDAALSAAVELCLAEYSDGIRTEEEIQRYLRDAMDNHNTVVVSFPDEIIKIWISSSSSSATEQGSFAVGLNEYSVRSWS